MNRISPGMVGTNFDQHPRSLPTKKLHLGALRAFFDQLMTRQVLLIYTAVRAGAVAALKLKDLQWDGTQYPLRHLEKAGKVRSIPARHDLPQYLLDSLQYWNGEERDRDEILIHSIQGRTGVLTQHPLGNIDICRFVKRRLRNAGLPQYLSPHSFRIAKVTDLLRQGIPLEDVQNLAGHADPRTTRIYDRRQQRVTRNTVKGFRFESRDKSRRCH